MRVELLDQVGSLAEDPDLTRLADGMASPQARLLTRGRAEAGPTLEVAHEALLRVEPVRGWIEEFSVELRLRDEIEREALEWQKAETRLIAARKETDQPKQLEALQKELETAIAARRGPRLEAAMRLIRNPSFARAYSARRNEPMSTHARHRRPDISTSSGGQSAALGKARLCRRWRMGSTKARCVARSTIEASPESAVD